MVSHGNLASNGLALHQVWGFCPGDVVLHALPVFHVHGLFVAVHCAMLNGSPMLYLPKFDAALVTDQLRQVTALPVNIVMCLFFVRIIGTNGRNV